MREQMPDQVGQNKPSETEEQKYEAFVRAEQDWRKLVKEEKDEFFLVFKEIKNYQKARDIIDKKFGPLLEKSMESLNKADDAWRSVFSGSDDEMNEKAFKAYFG